MKNLILTLLATALGLIAMAQVGTIENLTVEQRTDGSGMVDISFDLMSPDTDQYNISIEASFDGGDTYTPVGSEHLTGDITEISPATGLEILWDGMASHPDVYSEETMLKIVASLAEDNGNDDEPGTVTDIDGNVYTTVIIGNQEWMAENLRVTRDANGNDITRYCYDNDPANCDLYGGLYTWHTVMNGATKSNPSNVQGICPTGWHLPGIPGIDEWTQLEQYICNQLGNANCETQFPYDNSTTSWRGTNEGNALKSCRQVSSPLGGDCATSEHPRWNSHSTHYGTDEFGFSALPGGYRNTNGSYDGLGSYGKWWSSTEYSHATAWRRCLGNVIGSVNRNTLNKGTGLSVRCVRDN